MKAQRLIKLLLGIGFLFSQPVIAQNEMNNHLPKATPKGMGKIDTRVDNMGYWTRMAGLGYVEVAPMAPVQQAIFKGSEINIPGRGLRTTDSPDLLVTTVNSTQSENSIFIKPGDYLSIFNSNNSTTNPVDHLYGADYLQSSDGGGTWGGGIDGTGGDNSGDPTTGISLDGRYYSGFINNNSGQSVAYSINGGVTWSVVVCGTVANPGSQLLDKNHLWVDISPSSSYLGYVYNAWSAFLSSSAPQIRITRSTNGGSTWSTPVNVSSGVSAGSLNHGVNLHTGPNGELYVVWAIYDTWPSDETALGFTKSTDGGASYATASRIISNIRGIRNSGTSKNQRVNSFPSMTVDISGGPYNGTIYVVWTNIGVPGTNTGTDRNIYMIKSTNQGSNWSAPVKVNQDPIGQGKQHYFPWITCDPVKGDLSVIFYDDRNVSSSQCETWVANSTDGGATWTDFRVSDVAFTPAPIPGLAASYMGDYLGISAREGRVYPSWTDNRTGTTLTYVSPFDLLLYPVAKFAADNTTSCLDSMVVFTDLSTRTPTSWNWTITPTTFSYVNATTSSSQNPQVQFTATGNYTVRLIATNTYGADTMLRSNYITVTSLTSDFIANITEVEVNYPVVFTNFANCGITSWSWNFGSGAFPATSTTVGPCIVSYSTTGLKTVSLTVNGSVNTTKTNYINVIQYLTYCLAGTSICDEYIGNVTIGQINNSTSCTIGGYANYKNLSTTVSPGYPYSINVTNGTPYTLDQCGMWVDWDHDGDFTDPDEQIAVSGTPGGGPYTATITPPVTALQGNKCLRIRITYNGSPVPCGIFTYGEVEDYSLYVGIPGLWKGGTTGVETDWNTAANWDDGRVPATSANIVIPAGRSYYPLITASHQCNNMQIQDGATMTIQGVTLTITGNLIIGQGVGGTLTINGGTCNVTGFATANNGSVVHLLNGGVMND
jgi:PKD repeat protein